MSNQQYPYTSTVPYGNYPNQSYPTSPPNQNFPYPQAGYPAQNMSGNYPTPGAYENYPNQGMPPQNYPQPVICGDYSNQVGPGMQQPSVCPTAPDLGQMQIIPGYEGLTFDDAILPPPYLPEWRPDEQHQKPLQNLPSLKEEDVREAVAQFSAEHCCYSSKVSRDMAVREIMMMSAFHYKLETFCEKRESAWRFEPFTGQPIDGPGNGPAPGAWDVQVSPLENFKNTKVKTEVPHTAFIKPCHTCVGNARVRCENCLGNGRKQCTWCNGRGRRIKFDKDELCTSCNATGFDRCISCDGSGQVKCKTCKGKGTLKGFVELTITWTNHQEDFISDTSNMPKELVLKVTGQLAYEEENPRVFPITQSSQNGVIKASTDLINKHSTAFVNERILRQRQCLRLIPIGKVQYQWKDKTDEFYVYGFEHKVYFKKYPQKCACVIS